KQLNWLRKTQRLIVVALGMELGSIRMEEVQILYDCTSTGLLDDKKLLKRKGLSNRLTLKTPAFKLP
ncbi:hypothetical protein PanWU01x14_128480, partial [Parasponia andersonii]